MPEGQQSPPPERQSGRQLNDPPANGQGIQKTDIQQKKQQLQQELENLESNPKPVTEDAVKRMFAKEPVQKE